MSENIANDTKAKWSRSSGGSGSCNNSEIRDAIDPAKDLVIERIKECATKEESGARRIAVDVRIECVPGCSGCGPLLKAIRSEDTPNDEDSFNDRLATMAVDKPEVKQYDGQGGYVVVLER